MPTKSRPKPAKEKADEEKGNPFPLAVELSTYEAHLPGWAKREGQFVLIKGRDILGFYPRHEQALEAGYDQVGAGPFLVKQILAHEPVYQLGHVEL